MVNRGLLARTVTAQDAKAPAEFFSLNLMHLSELTAQ